MNPERLLEHYHRIADAENAVPQLRRFVLDLAVHGKLVKQDPADEPATELLKQIAVEKARLVKAGEFREPRNAVEINRDALPFTPPSHWTWSRLIEIAQPSYGFAFKSSQFNGEKRGMPLIRIRDISRTDTEAYYEGDYDPAYLVRLGDYLVGMDGNFNLRCWQGPDGLLNQRVMRINSWRCKINPEFVKIPLQMVLDYLHGDTSLMTVKHLSAKQVNGIEIPLPPLTEQHRIVVKVDELTALCDQLETARNKREATRDQLTAASLTRLTAPNTGREVFGSHARFALGALPALTARPGQIKALRQIILNLAVRGKLIEQDPADEPATGLLKRIAKEKKRLIKAGEIKKLEPLNITNESLYKLPKSWILVPLGKIVIKHLGGGTPSKMNADYWGGDIFWASVKDIGKSKYLSETIDRITDIGLANSSSNLIEPGNLLVVTRMGLGKISINRVPVAINQDLRALFLSSLISIDYAYIFFLTYGFEGTGLTVKGIRLEQLLSFSFPLPPLTEQHRIVAKVDELMALCDRLEAAQSECETTRQRLLEALLHKALSPEEKRKATA